MSQKIEKNIREEIRKLNLLMSFWPYYFVYQFLGKSCLDCKKDIPQSSPSYINLVGKIYLPYSLAMLSNDK